MANHYTALLTHSPPITHSLKTAVPGQTPLLLLNNMCRRPFVSQAAGRLLVHTFSPTELRGRERAIEIPTLSPSLFFSDVQSVIRSV